MTNAEMIAFVQKRGHVAVPVLTRDDVEHLIVDKTDLVARLRDLDPDEECLWEFLRKREDGVRILDATA